MKTWELIEQLQGRDPSGEVVLTLAGDGFKYAANFDLSPPANRRVILETDAAEIGADTGELEDQVEDLEAMVDDLQSALQKITLALGTYKETLLVSALTALVEAIENSAEISTRKKP